MSNYHATIKTDTCKIVVIFIVFECCLNCIQDNISLVSMFWSFWTKLKLVFAHQTSFKSLYMWWTICLKGILAISCFFFLFCFDNWYRDKMDRIAVFFLITFKCLNSTFKPKHTNKRNFSHCISAISCSSQVLLSQLNKQHNPKLSVSEIKVLKTKKNRDSYVCISGPV